MMHIEEAQVLAEAALREEGCTGAVSWRPVQGGWRFWAASAPGVVGAVHVVVAAASGTVRTVPAGAPDHVVEAKLTR